jgi:hypothetical protein
MRTTWPANLILFHLITIVVTLLLVVLGVLLLVV